MKNHLRPLSLQKKRNQLIATKSSKHDKKLRKEKGFLYSKSEFLTSLLIQFSTLVLVCLLTAPFAFAKQKPKTQKQHYKTSRKNSHKAYKKKQRRSARKRRRRSSKRSTRRRRSRRSGRLSARPVQLSSKSRRSKRQVYRVKYRHYRISNKLVRFYQNRLGLLTRRAQAMPYRSRGKYIGFQLAYLSKKSPIYALGFRENDVITHVNGYNLNSMSRLMYAYFALRSQKKFKLDFLRKGRKKRHFIELF